MKPDNSVSEAAKNDAANNIIKFFILGWIGILIAMIDIPVRTSVMYPAFLPFETEAPVTVDMVINRVIGPALRIDLCPDLIAYLLIMISVFFFGKTKKYFYKRLPLLLTAAGLHTANMLLPFYLNGNPRFRLGYLFYFLACLSKVVALFEYSFCFTKMEECMANHSSNTVTVIVLMISFLTGFIHYVLAFYQLTISSYIYLLAHLVTLFYALYRLWQRRRYLQN